VNREYANETQPWESSKTPTRAQDAARMRIRTVSHRANNQQWSSAR
jgi:hypothetical protein